MDFVGKTNENKESSKKRKEKKQKTSCLKDLSPIEIPLS